jgi:hypothetical protein
MRPEPKLPACVVHQSFPKRRREGKSDTILVGIAIRPYEVGTYRLFAIGDRGHVTLPKRGATAEQALNFLERMHIMCEGIVENTPKKRKR